MAWVKSAILATALIAAVLGLQIGETMAQDHEAVMVDPRIVLMPGEELSTDMERRGVIRLARIRLPADLFSEAPPGNLPEPVVIPIGDDRTVVLMEQRRKTTDDGKTYVIGVDELTPNSRFVMQIQNGLLRRGEIRLHGEAINLTAPEPDNGFQIFRMMTVDPGLLPEELEPVDHQSPGSGRGASANSDRDDQVASPESSGSATPVVSAGPVTVKTLVEVKLMVVYTPAAKAASESFWLESIADTIDFSVFLANIGYEDQAGVTLNLVHTQLVSYTETGKITEDIDRLACPCDHKMKGVGSNHLNEVFGPWKTHEADIVSLWVDSVYESGIANIMSTVTPNFAPLAVNVVDWGAATVGLSFDHEIGHNFGARHDRAQDPNDGLPYSHNHGFVNLAQQRVTIMAYPSTCSSLGFPCPRSPVWSDPTEIPVDTWGVASGPFAADNARALELSAPTVASFDQKHNLVGCCINTGTFLNKDWRPGPCP